MNPTDLTPAQLSARNVDRLALIWEITQATIAIALTGATIFASISGIVSEELSNAFFIIVGFYFGRLISKNVPNTSQTL